MISLEEAVIRKLKTSHHVLSTIESCTGGLIAHLITNVSGASEVYFGSTIVYDNSLKFEIGVPKGLLDQHGAVSPEVAASMAEKGLEKMQNNAEILHSNSLIKPRGFMCIATTGIAGPTGGSRGKPVGLCYIALAITGKTTLVEKFIASETSERSKVKLQFAHKALEMIRGST